MTPDPIEGIADPLERQRAAIAQLEYHREQWKREARKWATIRAEAVQELKQGRTWAQVAELLGVSEPTAWNIAHPKIRPPASGAPGSRHRRPSAGRGSA